MAKSVMEGRYTAWLLDDDEVAIVLRALWCYQDRLAADRAAAVGRARADDARRKLAAIDQLLAAVDPALLVQVETAGLPELTDEDIAAGFQGRA